MARGGRRWVVWTVPWVVVAVLAGLLAAATRYHGVRAVLPPRLTVLGLDLWRERVYAPDWPNGLDDVGGQLPPAGVCTHVHPVNTTCPRYVSLGLSHNTGLGHRLSEVLFGWAAAAELGATYVVQDVDAWVTPREDQSYWWVHGLLGMAAGEVIGAHELATLSPPPARVVVCPYTEAATARHAARCNVHFELATYSCCPDGDCFKSIVRHGLYDQMKACLRWKRAQGALLPRHTANIVWHVRVGDISLHNDDPAFFRAVWAQLADALRADAGVPVVHAVVVTGPESRPTLPAAFAFLDGLLPNLTVLPSQSAYLGLAVMEAADVLISTGSSFPEVAALVNGGPIFLQHLPKHVPATYDGAFTTLMEYISDAVPLYPSGRLGLGTDALRARLHARLCPRLAKSALCA
jgi:hypothetical protein